MPRAEKTANHAAMQPLTTIVVKASSSGLNARVRGLRKSSSTTVGSAA